MSRFEASVGIFLISLLQGIVLGLGWGALYLGMLNGVWVYIGVSLLDMWKSRN